MGLEIHTKPSSGEGGGGETNLGRTLSATQVVVTSDTGTDATIPAADATNAGVMTKAMYDKLDGIEASADVTDAVNVGSSIHGATAKTTPVDADTVGLIDSAASNVLKKVTWANIKATLKAYFDNIYASTVYANTDIGTGTLTVDTANGLRQKVNMTGNITVAAPVNPVAGMELSLALTAAGGSARTITLGSITAPTGYTFSGVVASGSVRRLQMYYTGSAWLLTSNLEFA
jgi:hypothetical protein